MPCDLTNPQVLGIREADIFVGEQSGGGVGGIILPTILEGRKVMDFVQGGVIRLLSVLRAILASNPSSQEITDNNTPALLESILAKDKLYDYPSHRLLQ